MKKLLSLFLTVLLIFSVAACSGNGESDAASSDKPVLPDNSADVSETAGRVYPPSEDELSSDVVILDCERIKITVTDYSISENGDFIIDITCKNHEYKPYCLCFENGLKINDIHLDSSFNCYLEEQQTTSLSIFIPASDLKAAGIENVEKLVFKFKLYNLDGSWLFLSKEITLKPEI